MANKDFVVKNSLIVGDTATINGVQIDLSNATSGKVLKFDGTKFAPASEGDISGTVYTATIGDGTNSSFTLTHNFNTRDVVVTARNAASPYEVINVRWEAETTNTVVLDFSSAPSSSSVRVGIYAAVSGTAVASIDDLSDVIITSSTTGDLLKWSGSAWVNASGYATLASPTFTGNVSGISATMVGLGSVDNTADTAKPVSTAQQTALDLKANLASPALTGTPTAPTAAANTNTTQVATTAFVTTAVAGAAVTALDNVGDVTITSASSGQVLQWNGSAWINATVSSDVMTDAKNAALIIMDIGA